jgi:hybrid cluster-associated redox disulfide protein
MAKTKRSKKITKDMKISEVIEKYPETMEVFLNHGLHCFGCALANVESIEQGALSHEISKEEIGTMIDEANKLIESN